MSEPQSPEAPTNNVTPSVEGLFKPQESMRLNLLQKNKTGENWFPESAVVKLGSKTEQQIEVSPTMGSIKTNLMTISPEESDPQYLPHRQEATLGIGLTDPWDSKDDFGKPLQLATISVRENWEEGKGKDENPQGLSLVVRRNQRAHGPFGKEQRYDPAELSILLPNDETGALEWTEIPSRSGRILLPLGPKVKNGVSSLIISKKEDLEKKTGKVIVFQYGYNEATPDKLDTAYIGATLNQQTNSTSISV